VLASRVNSVRCSDWKHRPGYLLHLICTLAEPHCGRADIVAGQCLFISKWLGFITEEKHPKTRAYLDRVMQRPAFETVFLPPKEA